MKKKIFSRLFRYIVPFSVAVMLTFNRNGFLQHIELYTSIDLIINYFVSGVALFILLRQFYDGKSFAISRKDMPFIVLLGWILFIILISSNSHSSFDISQSAVISCAISIILGFGIKCSDYSRLRRSLIILSTIFALFVLIYAPSDILELSPKSSAAFDSRIGAKSSASLLIIFPRALYTLVLAGISSFIIEKNILVKVFCLLINIPALVIAFGTAGRGGLLGLFSGVIIFIYGIITLNKSHDKLIYLFYVPPIIFFFYFIYLNIQDYFPILFTRISDGSDSGRYEMWGDLLNTNLSVFGYGPLFYPHNVFFEFALNYGIIGFILFIIFIINSLFNTLKLLRLKKDVDLIFVVAIITFQFVGQQFSLNIFYSSFALAMVLFSRLNLKIYNSSLR